MSNKNILMRSVGALLAAVKAEAARDGQIDALPGHIRLYNGYLAQANTLSPGDPRLAPLFEAQEGVTTSGELYALVGTLHAAFDLEIPAPRVSR